MVLDNFRTIELIWDKANKSIIKTIKTASSDTTGRYLSVKILDGGQEATLDGASLQLYWEHPNFNTRGTDNFEVVNNGGLFRLKFSQPMQSNVGVLNANLVLKLADGIITSDSFEIEVIKGSSIGVVIPSNGESAAIQALYEAMEKLNNFDGGPSIFMDSLSELQSTYPNGASGVALVRETDPAKIYVWNGSTWENFGDYQGIEIKDGAVTTPKIANEGVTRDKIADNAISNDKITGGAVTGDKISTRTITGENIALQGIERENIKDNAIGNAKIVDRAVTGNKILDGTIVSDKLADNAITRSKVSNGSITYDKTNFAKLIDEINLFDGNFFNFNLAGSGTFTYIANPSTPHFSTIMELTPGKSYSISTNPDYTGTIKGATASSIVSSGQLNGSFSYSKTTQNGDSRIFTASDNDNYLYIDMYAKGFLKVVESQIPVVSFAGETYPIFESKKEVDNIVWFGDSISCLRKLPDRVENLTGNKVYDVSIAGSTGSTHTGGLAYDGTSFVSLVDAIISGNWQTVDESAQLRSHWKNDENISTLKTIDFNTIDKVVLFYGTNDYGGSENSIDTFKNGMKSSIEKLLNQYPHLQFYFVTPLFREDWETFNSQGLTLKPYIDEVVDIAKSYGYPVYNGFENSGINQFNSDYYLNDDGLHQNDIGDKLLGDKLSKFLKSN